MGVAVAVVCMLAILAEIINDLHTVTCLVLTRKRGQETTCTEIPARQHRGEDIYPTHAALHVANQSNLYD